MPKMRAGDSVVARSASSADSPFSLALRMPGMKSPVLPAPLTSANVAPLFCSAAGELGASWRSRMTRSGCSSRSSLLAGATGHFTETSTGMPLDFSSSAMR